MSTLESAFGILPYSVARVWAVFCIFCFIEIHTQRCVLQSVLYTPAYEVYTGCVFIVYTGCVLHRAVFCIPFIALRDSGTRIQKQLFHKLLSRKPDLICLPPAHFQFLWWWCWWWFWNLLTLRGLWWWSMTVDAMWWNIQFLRWWLLLCFLVLKTQLRDIMTCSHSQNDNWSTAWGKSFLATGDLLSTISTKSPWVRIFTLPTLFCLVLTTHRI